jgi:hypothetical protein
LPSNGPRSNCLPGFVSYGGTLAVEHLRLVCADMRIATDRSQLAFRLVIDFENFVDFKPA